MPRTRRRVKTRREFLKQSAMTAGMLPLFGGGYLSFAGVKSPLDPSAITKLRRSFSGHLVVPGDPDYDTARVSSMNPEVDRFPAIVAQCANEDDVLRCIDFSHQQKPRDRRAIRQPEFPGLGDLQQRDRCRSVENEEC